MNKRSTNFIGGTPTTIRVPEKFLERIKALSDEIGDSQNGTMLHLMFLGMKVYEGAVSINYQCACPAHRLGRLIADSRSRGINIQKEKST